jgi:hypothetical protein
MEGAVNIYSLAVRWEQGKARAAGCLTALLVLGGCSADLGPAVEPPSDPEVGEVARFWFDRPGNNQVSVGPFAVEFDELVVRGACRSVTGRLTWKVFDNSDEADTADEVKFLDQGEITCDGAVQRAVADVGAAHELGVLGMTGTEEGRDSSESAWLTLANE